MVNYSSKTSHDGDPDKYSIWHDGVLGRFDFKDKDVLDIGCGTGGFLKHIRDTSRSVVGIDPNPENCRIATDLGLRTVCDYPENVSGMDNSFDIATCFEVIEHLYDHHGVMLAMSRMLRSGGVAIISTPNAFNIMRQIKFVLAHEHHDSLMDPTRASEPEHIRGWSMGMMKRLADKNDRLKVTEVYGVGNIFGRTFVFRNSILTKFLAQHLIAVIKKS